jgi:pyruvate dehydrogenase E2 component (dihydrolipoamide acetyltransferase)
VQQLLGEGKKRRNEMPIEIVMPKLGLTMSDGVVVEWRKNEGDEVKKGEVLFVIETEKVTFEVECPEDGILAKIIVMEKQRVAVGVVVAYLLRKGESASALEVLAPGEKESAAYEGKEGIKTRTSEQSAELAVISGESGDRKRVSALAKRIAKEYQIDLELITGTGPGGRIVRDDVEKAFRDKQSRKQEVVVPPEAPKSRLVGLTEMRRTIAKRMLAAKVTTAQTYMTNSIDATRILECREILLQYVEEKSGVKVTITDILLKVTGAAIREHPIMNTKWTDDGIVYFEDVHMGMAMALDDGLIVPVIREINNKGIAQISQDRLILVKKGKDRKFVPNDISGSTFTLSSMGMFGVEEFTANINLPESGILAAGNIIEKVVVVDGTMVLRPIMRVTLTYDHRAIDGAEAGKFMRTLKRFMENPLLILA